MCAVTRVLLLAIGVISGGSIYENVARADALQPFAMDDGGDAVKQAFARLAQQKTYRIESKGRSGASQIDSRVDVQFPDHFHILNRGPNPSELILTPNGSFAKTDANSPWQTVPMSYLSIAESLGPKANVNLLKSMQRVTFKGFAKCPGDNAQAERYQFETDNDGNAKAPMRTTITIAKNSGLPCRIRAQQTDAAIDTTAIYDYTSEFIIRAPK